MLETLRLPTHLANTVRRLNVIGADSSADTFLGASYVIESFIKTVAVGLVAGFRINAPQLAFTFDYDLIRADGLGVWDAAIGNICGASCASYLHRDLQGMTTWLIQKRTQSEHEWVRTCLEHCSGILSDLGAPDTQLPLKPTVRHLLTQLVRIRNKARAHGAASMDFFSAENSRYIDVARLLLENSPFNEWEWFHLSTRDHDRKVRAIQLLGVTPSHVPAQSSESLRPKCDGLHFRTHAKGHLFHCGELLRGNRECTKFLMPNGGYTDAGSGEFLDYSTGYVEHVDLPQFRIPPAQLPPSSTEGEARLDVYSNIYGNLPSLPDGYVHRPQIEGEITERLRDKNHTIITLHGRGGIGKTSLGLFVAHSLSKDATPEFGCIIWLSARDIDLRLSGPKPVRRSVSDIESLCKTVGRILQIDSTIDSLALLLQNPAAVSDIGDGGILFVIDNFETMDSPRDLHEFLDTHTHIPNKILITSRERSFKGDYPIEVGGMEYPEAVALLSQETRSLGVQNIVPPEKFREIVEYTDGHAYVMRVLLGEIAKERKWVPLKSLVPKRPDLLNAVFERSFNRLTDDARWAFLSVANWRFPVSELVLHVVLGLRELDAEKGLEECVRMSLLSREQISDEMYMYSAPELARLFAKKKLEGDPDRLLISEDLGIVRDIGGGVSAGAKNLGVMDLVKNCVSRGIELGRQGDQAKRLLYDSILEGIAELCPAAWMGVADYRLEVGLPREGVEYALRRAVEGEPWNKTAWIRRASIAAESGDQATQVACLISAVECDQDDVQLIRDTALSVCQYVDAHKLNIPQARRGIYLANVRSHMERIAIKLDATGLSRLAWLFLLEGDEDGAWKYGNKGLEKEPTNQHCLNIVQRLKNGGYSPPQ